VEDRSGRSEGRPMINRHSEEEGCPKPEIRPGEPMPDFDAQQRTPDVLTIKRLVPHLRGGARRPFRVTVFSRRQPADGTTGVSLPHLPGRTRSALRSAE
jgi:hypothetical protein